MSEEQRIFFEQRYRGMSTEDLVEIYRKGNLTDTASHVLELVLTERNVSSEAREAMAAKLKDEAYEEQFELLASLGDRFLGQLIDSVIAICVGTIMFFLFRLLSDTERLPALAAFSGWLLYNLMSDGLDGGQSFGKKITKTAVVYGTQKAPCSFWRSFLRNTPLLILGIIDWLFIFGHGRKRLGDHIAGTEVIKTNQMNQQSHAR